MQIVIDIPENLYKATINGLDANEIWDLRLAVKNGKTLPKGHGRIIDVNELKKIIKESDILTMTGFSVRLCDIDNTPTIIEADKESK